MDQRLSYYSVGHSSNKWWRYLFHWVINLCIVQSFLTWERSAHSPTPPKGYDHLRFRLNVVEQLRAGFTSRKIAGGRPRCTINPTIASPSIHHHKLVKIDGRKRVCSQCSKMGRRTPSSRGVETSFMCAFCEVPLCRGQCFREFHDEHLVHK